MPVNNKLVLIKEEYQLLNACIRSMGNTSSFDKENVAQLAKELKEGATLVEKGQCPTDVIRLNSQVVIKDAASGKLISFRLVLPAQANLSERKVSVLAPMGTAVIGYRKGQTITWQVPAGKKVLTVMEVSNEQ